MCGLNVWNVWGVKIGKYYENGNLWWKCNYVNGRREGIENCYYENGNLYVKKSTTYFSFRSEENEVLYKKVKK